MEMVTEALKFHGQFTGALRSLWTANEARDGRLKLHDSLCRLGEATKLETRTDSCAALRASVRHTKSQNVHRRIDGKSGEEPDKNAELAGSQTWAADAAWRQTLKPIQEGAGPDRRKIEFVGELVLMSSLFLTVSVASLPRQSANRELFPTRLLASFAPGREIRAIVELLTARSQVAARTNWELQAMSRATFLAVKQHGTNM